MAVIGFKPIADVNGGQFVGALVRYHVASSHSTKLAIGDLVKITGTAHTDGTPEVDAAAAAGLLTGVIVGVEVSPSSLEQKHLPASTAGYVLVAQQPKLYMKANYSGGTPAVTDVGGNADIVATEASASGGLMFSNMKVDASSFGSATAQVRLEKIVYQADGSTIDHLIVSINESTVTGVVGV